MSDNTNEPTEWGSIVLARLNDASWTTRVRWVCLPPMWQSEDGDYECPYSWLRDVEVLRVGVGEPTPPAEAVEADKGCGRCGEQDCMDCWPSAFEPTPEQVEAASAPGVPVTDEMVAKARKAFYGAMPGTFDPVRAALEAVLLPKEPTS